MRELTFRGYLTQYVRTLSCAKTTRMETLVREAAGNNPRLREPLFLYAMFSGKTELLQQSAKHTALNDQYAQLLAQYNSTTMEETLQQEGTLPENYTKVWRSYQSRKHRLDADHHTKDLMRRKVLALQQEYHVTNYRIYTDLQLNPGNLNAWLKHGDSTKVSLDTARSVLAYMKGYETT